MKKLPRLVALAAASTLALGSTACFTIDRTSSEEEDSTENGDEAPEDEEDGESDLDALVGVWEYEDPNSSPNHPGPDSELTVDEEGNASHESSNNYHGPREGPIVENEDGQLIFESYMEADYGGGNEEEVEEDFEIVYNEDDDTMTMIRPDNDDISDRVHERTE